MKAKHYAIKAASQSSLIPLFEKDAAIGIVPYIHKGEAIPSALAITIPNTPATVAATQAKYYNRLLLIMSYTATFFSAEQCGFPCRQY